MSYTMCNRWMAGILALTLGAGSLQAAEASEVAAFKSIVNRLDVGGNELEVINPTRFLKLLNAEITVAEAEILERMPDQQKEIEMMLAILRSSGLFEVRGYGASSIAIADGAPLPLYRGRNFLSIDLKNPGWMVQALFPANRNLAELTAQLPDTTQVAFDWMLDGSKLQSAWATPLADLDEEAQARANRFFSVLTGRIAVVVFTYGEDAVGWRVSLPDPGDGALWDASEEHVVLTEDGRVTVFSNKAAQSAFAEKLAAGAVLTGSPEFKTTAVGLAAEKGVGFVYIRNLDVTWQALAECCPDFDLELFEAIRMNFDESAYVVGSRIEDGILLQSNSHADSSASMAAAIGRYTVPAVLSLVKSGFFERPAPAPMQAPRIMDPRMVDLNQVSHGLQRYAMEHNRSYPAADADAWKVLVDGGYIQPRQAEMGFLYLGAGSAPMMSPAGMMVPVVLAMPVMPHGPVGVIYADGRVEFFPMPGADSAKGVVSVLQSMRPMPEAEFNRVIEKAAAFDKK